MRSSGLADRSVDVGAGTGIGTGQFTLLFAIVGMAHGLGLRTGAEGVETREHATILRLIGVDAMQGYLFSRPLAGRQHPNSVCPAPEPPTHHPRGSADSGWLSPQVGPSPCRWCRTCSSSLLGDTSTYSQSSSASGAWPGAQ